jgi:hypothetical protein
VRYVCLGAMAALWVFYPISLRGQMALVPANAAIGRNLEAAAMVTLSEPAPETGLDVTLVSADPGQLRISKSPDQPGAASLVLRVRQGLRKSPEFWLQAMGNSGTVTYTASAQGAGSGTGTVTLTPSAIVITGPLKAPKFLTTIGGTPSKLTLYSARLDASLKYAEEQLIAGGLSVRVDVLSSEPTVGTIIASPLVLPGGTSSAVTHFRPSGEGDTALSVGAASGFSTSPDFPAIAASVRKPGLAVSDQLFVGCNLQVGGVLSLGAAAPAGGVNVTLVSGDPRHLLLSNSATAIGSNSISVRIAANGGSGTYFLQALGDSGSVSYTATAPGYQSRTATVSLAPAGIVITPASQGPPDEAHVLRAVAPESSYQFMTDLSTNTPTKLIAWTVQLDPMTHRAADITVQPLRAGLSLTVPLTNSNPAVGSVVARVTIPGGSDHSVTDFMPLSVGSTEIAVTTPKDFTPAANSTAVLAVVRD